MKIKVKIKTLILAFLGALFFIFGVIPFANIELANYLSNKKPEIAEKLYDNYIKYPTGLRKDEALYKSCQDITKNYSKYIIMLKSKTWGELFDYNTVIEAIEDNERIIKEYPKSDYYSKAYKSIMDCYIYLGNAQKLEEWIVWGIHEDREDINNIANLYKAYYHAVNREFDKAEDILNSYELDFGGMDYIYYFIKGHIAFITEDFEKALDFYKRASNTGWEYRMANFFGTMVPYEREYWLNQLNFHKGENKIRGRVTVDGMGIPFVEVYLKYPEDGISTRGNNFVAITDKDGYFETIGIKEGKYDIGIGIGTPILFDKVYLQKAIYDLDVSRNMEINFELTAPMKVSSPKLWELIKGNKFTIGWEGVEGADYYTVSIIGFNDPINMTGGSMTVTILDENREFKLKGNKAVFDLEIIKNSGAGYSFGGEEAIINPQAITGYFYKGVTIPIVVSAYDKNDNMLSSSVPVAGYYDNMPSIKVDGELTEGEKLILAMEYEKAIEYYENILAKDENNVDALSYLTRFNMLNWKKDKKDMPKAIDYGMKVYNITDDTGLIFKLLIEMEGKDYRANKELVAKLFDMIPKNDRAADFYSQRGSYYMAIGEFRKAREDFILAKFPYLNPDIIYISLYLDENEKALEILENEDTKFYYMSKDKLIEGIELLSKLNKNDKEYIIFKEYLTRLLKREGDYDERREDFKKVYGSIKNPGIKIILNEIKIDNHWN